MGARSEIALLIAASACFATGGLFMKFSDGATRSAPTAVFAGLFLVGAFLQAFAMRRADLGVVYIAVLGLEAAITAGLSLMVLHERWSAMRVFAVMLILAGVALLRRT
jgi:small multidrug resistance pump/quaternary ammonium compound-resistance protein SugE